jgi:DNA polymerase III subunit delta'
LPGPCDPAYSTFTNMSFRDVVGHRRLVDLLSRAVARDSLPPSLILAGPNGVGKRRVAVAVAQALNCVTPRNGREFDSCGTCQPCTRIARGVHPDVLVVEPGDNGSIKVDQVRDVVDRAMYRPFEGRRRVVIVDDADSLVPSAQNALLKTLEEPPPSSVFMLVTSRPDLLLLTVLSRCPRLRFRALDDSEVVAVLKGMGKSEADARAAAVSADGSIARALEASTGELVQARDVARRVLKQAAATADPRQRLAGSQDLLENTGRGSAEDRNQLATHLRAMASLVRDVELLSTRADAALANEDVRSEIERLSAFRGDRGIRAFTTIDQALEAIAGNAGVKVVADWVMVNL